MTPDDIINQYMWLAKSIARQYADKCSPNDMDEMLSAAYLGLVKAAAKPDATRRYVVSRIEGQIQDARRKNDVFSRRDRDIMRYYYRFDRNVDAVAEKLGLDVEFVEKSIAFLHSTFELLQEREEEKTHEVEREHSFSETLEVCLSILPATLHKTFLLTYRDQLNLDDIAETLHISLEQAFEQLTAANAILRNNRQLLSSLIF